MDDSEVTATILFLFLLLLLVIFYGFSQGIRQLNAKDIEKDFEKTSIFKKNIINGLMNEQTRLLESTQFIITNITLFMGWHYIPFIQLSLQNTLDSYPLVIALTYIVSFLILSCIILIFVYFISKKLALKHPIAWVKILVYPVYFISLLVYPFTYLYRMISLLILKIFRVKTEHDNTDVTEEEIISMVNEGQEQGILQASEAEMIHNIFEYSDKEAEDIMTPRKSIHAIDGSVTVTEAIEIMLEGRNSRYPVYLENLDHIIGVLNLKDALRLNRFHEISDKKVKDVSHLLRKAEYIPETRKIDILLKTMQASKTQIVIVIDEYGQTTGLITMEDILEEIVGNIMDEYDVEELKIKKKSESEFLVDGMMYLEEIEERFGIDFKEIEFDTLNGFIISKMDKIPNEDDLFEMDYDGYHFKVLKIENKMIKTCLLSKMELSEDSEN